MPAMETMREPAPRVRRNGVPGCALTAAIAAMGGRWKLFILYRLSDGPMHFAALRRSLPEVSAKVLAQQLREMQGDALVERESLGRVPARVEYSLTAHGRTLLPVAEAIRKWGIVHQAFHAGPAVDLRAADANAACHSPIAGP